MNTKLPLWEIVIFQSATYQQYEATFFNDGVWEHLYEKFQGWILLL